MQKLIKVNYSYFPLKKQFLATNKFEKHKICFILFFSKITSSYYQTPIFAQGTSASMQLWRHLQVWFVTSLTLECQFMCKYATCNK